METIFHEKQEGQLCAQHCLNALLQGPYYTAVDLAALAQQLDDEERQHMAEAAGSEEYRRFLQQPSGNMDDTGFFSVQVIARAIAVWGLELLSFSSTDPRAVIAKQHPTGQTAFICNYREHWLTVRRLGQQWFNLNSLLTFPELISDTYLGMFLTQLEDEGYTVYVVLGELPSCAADQVLSVQRVSQAVPPALIGERKRGARFRAAADRPGDEDADLQRALELSLLQDTETRPTTANLDDELELAIRLSQSMAESQFSPEGEDVTGAHGVDDQSNIVSEEDELQKAIQMSLEGNTSKTESEQGPPAKVERQSPKNLMSAKTSSPVTSQTSPATPSGQATPQQKPKSSSSTSNPIPMEGVGQRVGGQGPRGGPRESTPDQEEIRRRRLAFLEKMQK